MFTVSAAKIAAKAKPALIQSCRQMTVVSGPPQVKISPAEKVIHAVAIAFGILSLPAYVLVNIKNYRSHE